MPIAEACGVLAAAVRVGLKAGMKGADLLSVDYAFFDQGRVGRNRRMGRLQYPGDALFDPCRVASVEAAGGT